MSDQIQSRSDYEKGQLSVYAHLRDFDDFGCGGCPVEEEIAEILSARTHYDDPIGKALVALFKRLPPTEAQ